MIGLKGIPYPAGIEQFTEQIGWRLVERGHDVTVYGRPRVEVGSSYRGMKICRLPSINTKHLDALSHTLLATLHLLGSRVDIAHFHALGPSVFALLPRVRAIRTVVQVHGLDWQRAKWGAFARRCLTMAERSAVYFPHRTVAISQTLKRYLEANYGGRVDYVPTGVDPGAYRAPDEIRHWGLGAGDYVLFLSRLVPEKGCHYLIEAFEQIETDKKLVIAGGSSHSDAYADGLRHTKNPNIVFTGTVTGRTLEELFSNAYVYVLPSEVEGLPHTLLQAMSFGKCVLASDIEPNVEALEEHGMTFRTRDPEDLRHTLEYLLRHPEVVHDRSRQAKQHVADRYSWDAVVDRLEAVYEDCH